MSPLIRKQVSACRRRLNWINLIEKASTSLLIGLIAGAIFMLLTRIEELGWAPYTWIGIGAMVSAALLYSLFWAFITRQRDFGAAVAIDERLKLKERVSTALCFAEPTRAIERAVIEDAEAVARSIKPRRHFPIPRQCSIFWCLAPLVAIGALSLLDPLSLFGDQPEKANRTKVVLNKNEAAKVEKIENAIKKAIDTEKLADKTAVNKVKANLEKVFKDLKSGKMTRPQVVGELSSMQDRLNDRKKMLAKKLSPKTPSELSSNMEFTDEVSDRLEKGKFADAANQLNELKKSVEKKMKSGEMTDEDKQQLAKELNEMAKMMGANSELGQALKAAAQAAASSNAAEMSEQLDQAGMDMQDMQAMMNEMEMLNTMESLLSEQQECLDSKPGGEPGEGGT